MAAPVVASTIRRKRAFPTEMDESVGSVQRKVPELKAEVEIEDVWTEVEPMPSHWLQKAAVQR